MNRLSTPVLVALAVAAQAPVTLFGGPQLLRMSLIAVSAVFGWCALRRADLTFAAVVAAGIALVVVVLVVPPRGSRDVYSYISYGRMVAVHHVSPYEHGPADFPADPATAKVSKNWQEAPSVYGPVFTGVSAVGAWMTQSSLRLAAVWHQLLTAAAGAIVCGIVWKRTADPRALAFIVLNPMIGASLLTGAHNDLLVGLAVLGAVLVAVPKPWLAGVFGALACAVKVSAGLAVFTLAATARKLRDAVTIAAVAGGLFLAMSLPFGTAALKTASSGAGRVSRGSLWQGIMRVVGGPGWFYGTLGLLLLAGLTIVIVVRFRDQTLATGASLAAFCASAAWVLPWYAGWSMPLLALRRSHPFAKWTWWHAVFLLEAYQFGTSFGGLSRVLISGVVPMAFTAAFVVVTFRSPRVDQDGFELRPSIGSSLAS